MAIDPKVFKAYDIRGLSPQQIDADLAFRLGQAFVLFSKAKTVVVGRDMRDTTPMLFDALAKGVNSQGADVVDIGMVTTPMFYYAVADYDLHDAGVMITASHNPKEYNGFKMVLGDAMPIGAETGMGEIRDMVIAGPYEGKKEGTIVETDVRQGYLEKLFNEVKPRSLREMHAVVDTANGMEGIVLADVFAKMPQVTMTGMYIDLDGNFPNHEANPLKEETLDALKERIGELRADIGVAFDGDADRVALVDEKGATVRSDILAALLVPKLLEKEPGAAVLYDVRSSLVVAEEIERAGGRPVMCKVGHGLIKPHMRRENAIFGCELSGHYYFRELANAENSDLVMLMAFQLMSESGMKLSELVAPLLRYHHSGEINSTVEDKDAVFRRLEQAYGHEATEKTTIDGLRLDFRDKVRPEEDWWFSVRASNTEPLLRLNLEAKRKEKMEEKRDELLKLIRA